LQNPMGANLIEDRNYVLGHTSSLDYLHSRHLNGNVNLNFFLTDTDNGTIYRGALIERSNYTFFSRSGRKRILAKIYQEFEYEKYSSNYETASYLRLLMGTSYYPTNYLELGGEIFYEKNEPQDFDIMSLSVMAAMSFSALTAETRYSYGVAQLKSGEFDERKEHLFEAKLRKSF
jgi:hypothetical protein